MSIHHGVFPLRTRAKQAESTLELEQFVDQYSPQAIPGAVFEIQSIVDHRHVGDDIEYKVRWRGYGKRDDQWVLHTDVWDYGGSDAIVRYLVEALYRIPDEHLANILASYESDRLLGFLFPHFGF